MVAIVDYLEKFKATSEQNPKWSAVYSSGINEYFLKYADKKNLHIHAPGIRGGAFWLHRHEKSKEGKETFDMLDYSTEINFSEPRQLVKHIKSLRIEAPSEEYLGLLSAANKSLRLL